MEVLEDKSKFQELTELMKKISKAMEMSRDKQVNIDSMTEELDNETRITMLERRKEKIENAKNDKSEFDEMTKNALVNAKRAVLEIIKESEEEYQGKLAYTLKRQMDIQEKLASIKKRELPQEKIEKAEKSAQKASEKVRDEMTDFQYKHFELRKLLEDYKNNIWDYAVELGVEKEIDSITIEEDTLEQTKSASIKKIAIADQKEPGSTQSRPTTASANSASISVTAVSTNPLFSYEEKDFDKKESVEFIANGDYKGERYSIYKGKNGVNQDRWVIKFKDKRFIIDGEEGKALTKIYCIHDKSKNQVIEDVLQGRVNYVYLKNADTGREYRFDKSKLESAQNYPELFTIPHPDGHGNLMFTFKTGKYICESGYDISFTIDEAMGIMKKDFGDSLGELSKILKLTKEGKIMGIAKQIIKEHNLGAKTTATADQTKTYSPQSGSMTGTVTTKTTAIVDPKEPYSKQSSQTTALSNSETPINKKVATKSIKATATTGQKKPDSTQSRPTTAQRKQTRPETTQARILSPIVNDSKKVVINAETGYVLWEQMKAGVNYREKIHLDKIFSDKDLKKSIIEMLDKDEDKKYIKILKSRIRSIKLNPAILSILKERGEIDDLKVYIDAVFDKQKNIVDLPFEYEADLQGAYWMKNRTLNKLNRVLLRENKELGTEFPATKHLGIKRFLSKMPFLTKSTKSWIGLLPEVNDKAEKYAEYIKEKHGDTERKTSKGYKDFVKAQEEYTRTGDSKSAFSKQLNPNNPIYNKQRSFDDKSHKKLNEHRVTGQEMTK